MALDITRLEAELAEQNQLTPFSGVILVRENKQTVLARSYGLANKAESIHNKIDTRFGIASGAKILTAVAICQLVEQGFLSFDSYLKDCLKLPSASFDPAITIHHLLTHSSGIPDYFDEETMDDFEALWQDRPMYRFRKPQDFLPLFQNQPMKFKPGERFSYNNAGFIVLGLVVEQVSGLPFTRYVEENIFAKAGMSDSGYFALDRLPERTAYGYIVEGEDQWRTNIYSVPVIGGPDGGVFTTVLDMAKFWDSLLGYKLLNQATTEKMLTPHRQTGGKNPEIYYGYGVYMTYREDKVIAYHIEGYDPGVVFFSRVYPDKQIDYTVIANTEKANWAFRYVSNAVSSA